MDYSNIKFLEGEGLPDLKGNKNDKVFLPSQNYPQTKDRKR